MCSWSTLWISRHLPRGMLILSTVSFEPPVGLTISGTSACLKSWLAYSFLHLHCIYEYENVNSCKPKWFPMICRGLTWYSSIGSGARPANVFFPTTRVFEGKTHWIIAVPNHYCFASSTYVQFYRQKTKKKLSKLESLRTHLDLLQLLHYFCWAWTRWGLITPCLRVCRRKHPTFGSSQRAVWDKFTKLGIWDDPLPN